MHTKEITIVLTLLIISVCDIDAREVGSCSKSVNSGRCSKSGAHWQHDGVCISNTPTSEKCHIPDTRVFKFYLTAKLKWYGNLGKTIQRLWVRGSGPTLSWEKPKQMLMSARYSRTWSTEITYSSDSNSLLCLNTTHCSLNQGAIEFRISRDDLGIDDMLGPNFYVKLPISNSMAGVLGFSPPQVEVYPWFDSKSVTTEPGTSSPYLFFINGAQKAVDFASTILFPPSFNYNVYKTYPLIVMFGTHEVFHIVPLLEHMYVYEGSIEEAVIVSIHYVDEAPFCAFNPFHDYIQTANENQIWNCKAGDVNCHTCQTCWDPMRIGKCEEDEFIAKANKCLSPYSCTGLAGDVLDYIQVNLLAKLQERTQNRLQLDFPRQRISVVGFSGGGLLACFAALSRPLYYQNAACLSAPFHWPINGLLPSVNRNSEGMGRLMHDLNITLSLEPYQRLLYTTQKYYIDVGDRDNHYFPLVDAHDYANWVITMLKEILHLETETNIIYSNVPGAGNSYYHHKLGGTEILNRIKYSLIYFLGAEGGPSQKYAKSLKNPDLLIAERQKAMGTTMYDSSVLAGNGSQLNDKDCADSTGQRYLKRRQGDVPVLVFLVTVALSILVSVLGTVLYMYLRDANKKAEAKEAEEDEDLLEELGSSMDELDSDHK